MPSRDTEVLDAWAVEQSMPATSTAMVPPAVVHVSVSCLPSEYRPLQSASLGFVQTTIIWTAVGYGVMTFVVLMLLVLW